MTVLVSYVPTPEGWAALDLGIEQAGFRHVPIVVLNVAVGGNYADVTFADEKDLDAVRGRLAATGLTYDVVQVDAAADVADALLAAAEERAASLIVVALRRRSPVGKALLGSNAQRIILSADCPVLSVRPA